MQSVQDRPQRLTAEVAENAENRNGYALPCNAMVLV